MNCQEKRLHDPKELGEGKVRKSYYQKMSFRFIVLNFSFVTILSFMTGRFCRFVLMGGILYQQGGSRPFDRVILDGKRRQSNELYLPPPILPVSKIFPDQ